MLTFKKKNYEKNEINVLWPVFFVSGHFMY